MYIATFLQLRWGRFSDVFAHGRDFTSAITLQKCPGYLIRRGATAQLFAHFNCVEMLLVFGIAVLDIGRVVDGGVPILIWCCSLAQRRRKIVAECVINVRGVTNRM
jgi:hypothetical protein